MEGDRIKYKVPDKHEIKHNMLATKIKSNTQTLTSLLIFYNK